MNLIIPTGGPAITMTSREIADLTEKRHDNVKRTIETLANQGVISRPQIEEVSNDGPGPKTISLYRIGKRDSYVIVAQLSPEFTARLVDRWQALEAGAAPALNLRQPAQMLAVAMQLAEMVQEQQAQLTAQAPKVKFAEAVGASEDLQSVGEVAKVLGTGQRRLFAWLRAKNILMPNNLPYQRHIDCGRFRVIERTWKGEDGRDHIEPATKVTGRGVTYLQQLWSKEKELSHAA
jgi:anti-repressor protein